MKDVIAKTLLHQLKPGYALRNLKGHLTLVKEFENYQIKITNINGYKYTVTICISFKNRDGCDLVNYIKRNVSFGDIEETVLFILSNT